MAYEKGPVEEDESPEVSTDKDEPEEIDPDAPFPEYDDDDVNLAKTWDEHKQGQEVSRELASEILEKHRDAYDGSDEYRDKMSRAWELFTGNLPPKDFPYADCANIHVPIMIENITRNVARAESEIFGNWETVWGATPMGPAADDAAALVSLHMNWQFREQIPDCKRQLSRGMLMFFTIGDHSCHSFFDAERKQNRHEMMTPDEFAVPFTYTSTQPNYSDCPFYSKIFNLYRHAIQAKKDIWANVKKVLGEEPSFDDEPEQKLSDKAATVQGVDKGDHAPHKLIWFEGWLELPNQDRDRWCRAIVDYKTETLLELLILEEADWQDVERYKTQQAELESYRMEMQSYEGMLQEQASQVAQVAQETLQVADQMGDAQKAMVVQELQGAQEMKPPPPLAPTWLKDPDNPDAKAEAPKFVPIYLFTHFVCIEPLVGTLGLGFGRIQGDLNIAANTMMNQYVDAATFANVWCMIVSDQVQFTEKVSFRPGAIIKVAGMSGDEIKSNIMELKPAPPSGELIQGVNMLYQWGSSSMQAPSVLSGEPGKSGESAKLQLSRVEQATKQLSVFTRKFADSLEYVAKANAALNRVSMPDEEIIAVARERGGPVDPAVKISRELYSRGYRFTITADLRFTSRTQKVQEADELFMLVKEAPALAQNNKFMYEVIKKALMAREEYSLVAALGSDPGIPMDPMTGQPTAFGAPPPQPTGTPATPPGQPPPGAPPPPGGPPTGNTPMQGPPKPPAPPVQQPPQPMPQGQ